MEKPWKVIAAFIGVFIAGAVFGGFFSVGIGARWLAKESPATVTAAPVTVTATPTVAPATERKAAVRPNGGAGAAVRPPLLTVPQSWQAPALLRRYAERLELTPEQKQKIHPLIQRATEDYNRLRQNTWRETGIILQRLQQDISEVLTPEQREKLRHIEDRQRELLETEQKAREQRELQKKAEKAGAGQRPGQNRPPANGGEKSPAQPAPKPAASSGSVAPASSAPAVSTDTSSGSTSSTATASTEKQQ